MKLFSSALILRGRSRSTVNFVSWFNYAVRIDVGVDFAATPTPA